MNSSHKSKLRLFPILIVALILIFCCLLALINYGTITSDKAFIESTVYTVSTRVPGTIKEVLVSGNQFVKKGTLLAILDDKDISINVDEATAKLNIAKNETSADYVDVQKTRAVVQQTKALLDQAKSDFQKGETLFAKEAIPKERLERLKTAQLVAESKYAESEALLRKAQSAVGIVNDGKKDAKILQEQAQLDLVSTDLSNTRIYAPADGYVTRKSIEVGSKLKAGQSLMSIVALEKTWISANIKEKQIRYIKPGQKVSFVVDSYPTKVISGTVDSIAAATMGTFSLLPSENATDFNPEVTPRIPDKINIDSNSDPEHLFKVGMSVVPKIYVQRSILQYILEVIR